MRRVGGAQLLERARLDLPTALARDRHGVADLGEGARPPVLKAEAEAAEIVRSLRAIDAACGVGAPATDVEVAAEQLESEP